MNQEVAKRKTVSSLSYFSQKEKVPFSESFSICFFCRQAKNLETEDFIHTLPGQDTDQDRLIKKEGHTLQTRFTTKDGFTTYQMVKAGLGVSFNQAMIARDWKEEVVQVPLSPKRFVSLGMALPKKEKISPAVQRFMDCLEQWMVEFLK